MRQTQAHTTKKTAKLLVLAAVFLSILVSLTLPALLDMKVSDDEPMSLNFAKKEIKGYYENSDLDDETLEEIDLYPEPLIPIDVPQRNGSTLIFHYLINNLSNRDSDIQIPPPQQPAA